LRGAAALELLDLSATFGRLQRTTFRAPLDLLSALLAQDARRRSR